MIFLRPSPQTDKNQCLVKLQQQWVSDKLMEANVKFYTKQTSNNKTTQNMLDNTFQLFAEQILWATLEKIMIFWYAKFDNFPLQCQLESQPDNCFKSPMPKFQSWSILGTQLLRSYLRTNASPMLNLQYWHMVIFLPQAFLFFHSLLQSSFPVYPTPLYLGKGTHVVLDPSFHVYSTT